MYETDASLCLRLALGVLLLGSVIAVVLRIKDDYEDFLSLGPGGTPSTLTGYLKIKVLSLFVLRDPYEPPVNQDESESPTGHLASLPKRPHTRPLTKGIAPQRQITQCATSANYAKLAAALEDMAESSGNQFEIGTSCFEKHGTGIFSTSIPDKRTCKGEICHAHPSDGSLHLTLHPADVKVVLKAGWGERHPLARGGFFQRFVPHGFLMIYAPQTEEEIQIILQIVAAAARFVCGSKQCNESGTCGMSSQKQLFSKLSDAECPASPGNVSQDPLKVSC
ncbi:hypothetical protein Slin15195_G001290 [Septoria linicola]|uniref:Luciferase domain-containing protein n=1 Tax=Septoria linicola TaxID=215465 RepID=A0A9Q9AI31_9PEZI|nr:hypothetical protein Slin14017_G001320 [Septoria linicola]USW46810.1 hypothetical protein Slin15195_G001290 [Septoria linicola]